MVVSSSAPKASRSQGSSRGNLLSFSPKKEDISSDRSSSNDASPRVIPTLPVTNNRTSHRNKLSKPTQSRSPHPLNHTESAVVVSSSNYLESQPRTIDWQEDTAYFFCGQGERVLPLDHTDGPKEKLSILIPSQVLNVTEMLQIDLGGAEGGDVIQRGDYLIEISCHIRSMSVYEVIEPNVDVDTVVPI